MARLSAESQPSSSTRRPTCRRATAASSWRLVPLYVRFGDERPSASTSTSRPRSSTASSGRADQPPKCVPALAGRLRGRVRRALGYERILCVVLSAKLSGTYESASWRRRLRRARCASSTRGVTSGGTVILADAIQRRLDRGTDDEEIDALVGALQARTRPPLHRRHARVPRPRRADRQGGRPRRPAALREADPRARRRRGRAAQARPGRAKAIAELERIFHRRRARTARPACRRRPRRGQGGLRRARPQGAGCAAAGVARHRHDARPGHRHARRPRNSRPLLVLGPVTRSQPR